ncbi:MAG TPA: TIGR03118 family protein [Bryobacteraceae bacterium]|nr:TIGR03118 family protein [Bryobacteraceae bacterium]
MTRFSTFGRIAISCLALPLFAGTSDNAYVQHNLIADTPGVADFTDANLINPWGISESASSPFWVSDNRTGLTTVYNSIGSALTLKVTIPPGAAGGSTTGSPTGQVANTATTFAVATGKNASFIFCTEDGTISAWNSGVDASHAVIKVDNSSKGAVYKGIALGGTSDAPQLYVANFHDGTIEAYDGNFAPVILAVNAFKNSKLPAGFAPFNIVNLNGKLFVTYAKQDSAKQHDVAGDGNGYVDVYDMSGTLLQSLIEAGDLNSPWGLAMAPANFGAFSKMLLVGNFGNGRVNAYDPSSGAPKGSLKDPKGNTIAIDGLWALQVGNGKNGGDTNAVYFSAGPGGEKHGLFGSLQATPVLSSSNAVLNGASFQPGISQFSWISIFGSNLASTTRSWQASDIVDGKLPTELSGASVMVDGKPAFVSYISPTQINALVPADSKLGDVDITTANQALTSGTATASMKAASPAFFITKDGYVAARHVDGSVVGPTTLFPNESTPAKPGEIISLYATGFGPASAPIPDGQVISTAIPITGVTVTIGSTPAQVSFAGLVAPGLYQFNVTVPESLGDGDAPTIATVGSATTPEGPKIAVQH